MSGDRITLDTNILVYSVDQQAGLRHEQAASLVDQAVEMDCVLTLQALSEFFAAATRKGKMPREEAAAQIHDWQTLFPWRLQSPHPCPRQYPLSFITPCPFGMPCSGPSPRMRALPWSVAKDAGVTLLLSEDSQQGRELGGVRFRNPFRMEGEKG